MKAVPILILGLTSTIFASSLEDFRWKKRILVVTQSDESIGKQLREGKAGLAERDVEIFVLQGEAGIGKVPDKELATQLRERFRPEKGKPEIILIGKDGKTVLRWEADKFTPSDLFAKVDAMPMRKDEMRKE
ncbi:DUF4174 domain-containing protein [Luteolibacter sp. GHJ8]|uniref:DUF4174 domain-containing protein n=1 Tax=Luteolibacter rhizosphaerae TaxID=2989719 RepID=A0ABT3GB82_9BACT|nr:DUF4174 domain-containing protein [Luteolibacter rhizosphaerae]MCW1917096.1 DUF4174 domain-containing protein [Luteolibacter rhizosphaerae]